MPEHARHIASAILFAALAGCSQAPKEPAARTEKAPAPAPVYFKVDPATAGTVTGKISFRGKKPVSKKIDISEDPMCAKMHKTGPFDESVVVCPGPHSPPPDDYHANLQKNGNSQVISFTLVARPLPTL